MKWSNYNIYFPIEKGKKLLLYNTLSKAILVIDGKSRKLLRKIIVDEKLKKLDLFKVLEENGFLIKDEMDERKVYQVIYNQMKYDSGVLLTTIMTTYNCNLNCTFCYQKGIKKDEKELSMNRNTADAIVKFIKKKTSEHGFKELFILWYGGEPFLNAKVIKYILRELSPWIKITGIHFRNHVWTNGTLITKRLLKDVSGYNMSFQLSLNGTQEIHDKKMQYKNGQGTFTKIINTAKMLKDHGLQFVIRINVDKENYGCMESLLDYLRKEVGNQLNIAFYPVLPLIGPAYEHCIYDFAILQKEELKILPRLWFLALEKGFNIMLPSLETRLACLHLSADSYVINPLGEVHKCVTTVAYKEHSKHRIGIISENGKLSDINQNYLYKWLSIDPLERDECLRCKFLPICGGWCPLFFYKDYGYGEDYKSCTALKHILYSRILFNIQKVYSIDPEPIITNLINPNHG